MATPADVVHLLDCGRERLGSFALAGTRCLEELRGCDRRVGVLDDAGELVPVQAAVEADAQPASMPNIRRNKEPFGVRLDQHRL